MDRSAPPLLVGEVFVDFTITGPGLENKLRFGGISHAARAFWALGVTFNTAAIIPEYLEASARRYFSALGCAEFRILGRVSGAPNVITIFDAREVGEQGYESLLRDEKSVELLSVELSDLPLGDVLIFPGGFDLQQATASLGKEARLHIDVAYDVSTPAILGQLSSRPETVFTSTSSPWFEALEDKRLPSIASAFQPLANTVILKENRGGSRLLLQTGEVVHLPAQLGTTVNSVGVGDAFAASYVAHLNFGEVEAGLRATRAAAAYSQTTEPDLFKKYVQRDASLSLRNSKVWVESRCRGRAGRRRKFIWRRQTSRRVIAEPLTFQFLRLRTTILLSVALSWKMGNSRQVQIWPH
ncbi:MAG: hypothetical protein WDN76_07330 [Alphaproteobacteria bacterium]